ncbi:esterase FrsA [Streptacidiphilus sp. BW17]|uniref:alpha/beta hydrolase n=1 Tax=Streptacidiphilus sp. BW17 TaxID=3156274 RepID=UPI0035199114
MFTYDVDPQAVVIERAAQFAACGIPKATIARARDAIDDMWGTGETGWTPVWGREAERAAARGRLVQASLYWGAARFPTLATPARIQAHERQLECYLAASHRFPVRFHRQVDDVPTPLHLYRRRVAPRPGILVLSGGADTWKMDLHRLAVTTALATGLLVVTLDMPGTGESRIPLAPDSDRVYAEVIALLRARYGFPVGIMAFSFSGLWAARLALLGEVDAAVAIGAPTGAADEPVDVLKLPYGMAGIIGNALGMTALAEPKAVPDLVARFSLRELLDRPGGSPLLAVNGERDQYIPLGDLTGLAGRPDTTVWALRDATHCAPERFPLLAPALWSWLTARLLPGAQRSPLKAVGTLPVRPWLRPVTTASF